LALEVCSGGGSVQPAAVAFGMTRVFIGVIVAAVGKILAIVFCFLPETSAT
jgi:hypothetical protein